MSEISEISETIEKAKTIIEKAKKERIIAKLKSIASKEGLKIEPEEQLSKEEIDILFSAENLKDKISRREISEDIIVGWTGNPEEEILRISDDKYLIRLMEVLGDGNTREILNQTACFFPDLNSSLEYYTDKEYDLGDGKDIPIIDINNIFENEQVLSDSSSGFSKVDLEVERLKAMAELKAQNEPETEVDSRNKWLRKIEPDKETLQEVHEKIGYDENLDDIVKYYFKDLYQEFDDVDVLTGILTKVESDEIKLEAFMKIWNDSDSNLIMENGEHYIDPEYFAVLAKSMKDDGNREKAIHKIKEIAFDKVNIDEYSQNDMLGSELSAKADDEIAQDSYEKALSIVIPGFKDSRKMAEYYREINSPKNKILALDEIRELPQFQGELTEQELQEVSSRMHTEVQEESKRNSQTREEIQQDIMRSLHELTQLKQQYRDLTKGSIEK